MPSPVAALLKARTAATHDRVEAHLALLDAGLRVERLAAVIERFAGFWPVAERGVDAWAAAHHQQAEALCWPRRRRGPVLLADLRALGRSDDDLAGLDRAPELFGAGVPTDAEVLGWLYVAEGSTLGGAVIDRALRRHAAQEAVPAVTSFTPYAEGPGPMWRGYLEFLARWAGDDLVRAEAVARAAEHSFAALADWLEPLRTDAAA